ncbi:MAG: hypothetical protein NVS3B3_01410 [Aquirhabdus sp.]
MMSHKIAIVLPPREHFRAGDAGAVALTVYEFCKASAYANDLVVWGGCAEHFLDVAYEHVDASLFWLLGRNRAYARACIAKLKQNDQIKMVEVHNRIALALAIKKALPNLRVVLHIHNDPQGMAGAKTVAEREKLLTSLDLVYCVSEFVRKRILDGVSANLTECAKVIYNAISLLSEPDAPLNSSRQPWIVYAGRFIPEKGVLELAQALAKILPLYPDWKVVFLGAWGFGHQAGKSSYEQLVYSALKNVEDQTSFRGHVIHEEVMSVFGQASIAVSPSTGVEAFGRTTLEAMASGCAVVTSTSCGLMEVAGEAAILVNPVSVETLSQAITRLLEDSELRLDCAERCQQHAAAVFSLSVQVASLDKARAALLQ